MSDTGIEKYISTKMKLRIMNGETPGWMQRHCRSQYIRMSTLAAPLWVTRGMFRGLRQKEKELTARTGIPHVLDHIVPISHPFVCGLMVPWNIRVVPNAVNASKSNRWCPDQCVIEFPPQLSLF